MKTNTVPPERKPTDADCLLLEQVNCDNWKFTPISPTSYAKDPVEKTVCVAWACALKVFLPTALNMRLIRWICGVILEDSMLFKELRNLV